MEMKKPTLAEVAKFAGVGKDTVSRAYSNDSKLDQRLSEKILNIRDFLLYQESLRAKDRIPSEAEPHLVFVKGVGPAYQIPGISRYRTWDAYRE